MIPGLSAHPPPQDVRVRILGSNACGREKYKRVPAGIEPLPVGLGAPLRQFSGQIRVFPACCAVHLGGIAQVGRRIRDFRLFADLAPLFERLAEPLLGIARAKLQGCNFVA